MLLTIEEYVPPSLPINTASGPLPVLVPAPGPKMAEACMYVSNTLYHSLHYVIFCKNVQQLRHEMFVFVMTLMLMVR